MRKRVLAPLVGVGALAFAWAGLGGGSSSQAITCPTSGPACAVVASAYGTVCFSSWPEVGTIQFITIQTNGQVLSCPEL